MRRLLVFSFLGLAIAAVAVGGLYAPFIATDADNGTVTAGTVDIRLNTLKGVDEIVWDGAGCQSDQMAPGDSCTDNIKVRNDGTVELWYTVSEIETVCFDVSFTGPNDTVNGGDGNDPGHLPGGNAEAETIIATVMVVDDNSCQGETASVGISVLGTSD